MKKKSIEEQRTKQDEALKSLEQEKDKEDIKSIQRIVPKDMITNNIKNEIYEIKELNEKFSKIKQMVTHMIFSNIKH